MTETTQLKYEFVEGDEIIIAPGRTVKRIRALVAIAVFGVQPGDLGGYIESTQNLAQVYGKVSKTPINLVGLNWNITIEDYNINIGCQKHSADKWKNFTDNEISQMDEDALEFWNNNKVIILTLAENHGCFSTPEAE